MSDVVIRAEGLGKKYVIGHQGESERYTSLRDVLARGAREGEGDRRRSAARPNLAAAPISPLPAPPPLARPLAVSDFFVSRGCKLVKTVMHAPASLEQGHYSKGLASVFFADRASLLLAQMPTALSR